MFSTRAANLLSFFLVLSAIACLAVKSPIDKFHKNFQQFQPHQQEQEQGKQFDHDPLFVEKYPNLITSKFSFIHNNALPGANLQNCTKDYNCAQLDDPCNDNFATCSNRSSGLCCAQNLFCNNGTCVTDNIGSACQRNSDCIPSFDGTLVVLCDNGTCVQKYNTGDYCKQNSDCLSGTCDTEGSERCTGISKGSVCPPYPQSQACAEDLYCLGVCLPTIQAGSSCPGVGCAPGLTCVQGTCTKIFSVPDQGGCDVNNPFECQSDAICYSCGLSGNCLPGSTFTMHSCNENSDCTSNSCKCSPFTGKSYCELPSTAANCRDELQDLYECMDQNNCSYTTGILGAYPNNAPMSCSRKNCRAAYISYSVCQCYQGKTIFGDCYYETYCSKITLWLIIGIVVGIVVLACLVGCCIFICCKIRKRRAYSSV